MDSNVVQLPEREPRLAAGLGVEDMIKDLTKRIATGELRKDARCIVSILNPGPSMEEEGFDVANYHYGVDAPEAVAVLDCAKITVLRDMGFL